MSPVLQRAEVPVVKFTANGAPFHHRGRWAVPCLLHLDDGRVRHWTMTGLSRRRANRVADRLARGPIMMRRPCYALVQRSAIVAVRFEVARSGP